MAIETLKDIYLTEVREQFLLLDKRVKDAVDTAIEKYSHGFDNGEYIEERIIPEDYPDMKNYIISSVMSSLHGVYTFGYNIGMTSDKGKLEAILKQMETVLPRTASNTDIQKELNDMHAVGMEAEYQLSAYKRGYAKCFHDIKYAIASIRDNLVGINTVELIQTMGPILNNLPEIERNLLIARMINTLPNQLT